MTFIFLLTSLYISCIKAETIPISAPSGCKTFSNEFSSSGTCIKIDVGTGGILEVKHYRGDDCNENNWFYRVVYEVSDQKCSRASNFDLMNTNKEGYFKCKSADELELNVAVCEDRATLRTVGQMVSSVIDEPIENESAYRTDSCIVDRGTVTRSSENKCSSKDKLAITTTYNTQECKHDGDVMIIEYVKYENDQCYRESGSGMGFTYYCDSAENSFNSTWCNPADERTKSRYRVMDHIATPNSCVQNSNGVSSVQATCDGSVKYATFTDNACVTAEQPQPYSISTGGGCRNNINDENVEWLPDYFRAWCTDDNFLRVQECYSHEYDLNSGDMPMPQFHDFDPDSSEEKKGHGWVWVLLVIFILVGLGACSFFGYNYYKNNSDGGSLSGLSEKFGAYLPYSLFEADDEEADESAEVDENA